MSQPLLSICIPSYNRPKELNFNLSRLCEQISRHPDGLIELIITDDCSTDFKTPEVLNKFSQKYSFCHSKQLSENIGLEKNLIQCAASSKGKFLWIFGNDDYLEKDYSLNKIIRLLTENPEYFFILNRTRRNFEGSKLLTDNWMKIDCKKKYHFNTLKEFTLQWGFISIIGFITVNIFRREKFLNVNANQYFGTMYPQLGMMMEAFYDTPCLLIGDPLICHRTETPEEKKQALGNKAKESNFMSGRTLRDATYFSYPFLKMLFHLIEKKVYHYQDITKIPECTVINGPLIDFLINNLTLSKELNLSWDSNYIKISKSLLEKLPLNEPQSQKVKLIFDV